MIYLDNASTTGISPVVLEAMMPYLTTDYGNPGSVHGMGIEARKAVDKAREQVAKAINADPQEIIFTSGGSEANNLAVKFADEFWMDSGVRAVTSLTEHDSMKRAMKHYFPNTKMHQYLNPADVLQTLNNDDFSEVMRTYVSSFMYVNNELGFVNPVYDICSAAGRAGVLSIVDAVQALGHEKIDVREMHCFCMSLSSHKINGPKGVGALYVSRIFGGRNSFVEPLIYGGENQEFGLRGGTENVPGIVGFGAACEQINVDQSKTVIRELRKAFLETLDFDHVVNFDKHDSKIISLTVKDADAETLVLMLASKGVCISAGSACKSLEQKPNEVLLAAGLSEDEARHTVRVSMSHHNTVEEVREAAKIFNYCISIIRGN